MTASVYTAITFAPVQGFIEKSRKLRDLYGSSYILSLLSWAVCNAASHHGCEVVSPALINVTQGMPNQIIIAGQFPQAVAKQAFEQTWICIVQTCRQWIEEQLAQTCYWQRDWGLWSKHTWEFFWVIGNAGETIRQVRQRLNEQKRSRAWIGINWVSESSTLSGTDAIAWPELGCTSPQKINSRQQQQAIKAFYQALSQKIGEAFIDPDEELSIPELVKRIITHEAVAKRVVENWQKQNQVELSPSEIDNLTAIAQELNPKTFKDLNRLKNKRRSANEPPEPQYWTGWFLGDGDQAGAYLKNHSSPEELSRFSAQMREWGNAIRNLSNSYLPGQGRMIYAGGDDFMGVLYLRNGQIQPKVCLDWLSRFDQQFWQGASLQADASAPFRHGANQPKPITASVGFVWAAPHVPQRDVLQNCREAEQSAKAQGRDRIAFRILFNGGNLLEWVCPWWLLAGDFSNVPVAPLAMPSTGLLSAYCDRNNSPDKPNWTHLYNDVAALESRHAFQGCQIAVALGLIEVYFGEPYRKLLEQPSTWWNQVSLEPQRRSFSGILGSAQRYHPDYSDESLVKPELLKGNSYVIRDFNHWVINLAKVGFHLHRNVTPPQLQADYKR
ncbi:Cas10/Cmr2 second palm domain-containing protein [Almyronema epifaneia]|uniref:Type III-B CRISPR-associated protein Cas10/Cmr2 n=1 Tax=Almyronema epifaneia S1 TaxID=2991925 RepID=A0ABW6IK90_9CYAN